MMNKVVTFGTLVAEKWACEVPCIARPSLMDLFIWERGAFSEFSKNLKSLNTKGWALTQAWALPLYFTLVDQRSNKYDAS